MKAEEASHVKVAGHENEICFAELIGGKINSGDHTGKSDVVDKQGHRHSVKSGAYWQVFLYRRSRFEDNTVFREMGSVSELMIQCIDAFPPEYEDYLANKDAAKARLQPAMRALLGELCKPEIYPEFINKALFDGDDADYLSISMDDKKEVPCESRVFHIFHKSDVVSAFVQHVFLVNSKARNKYQTSDLKVIFKSRLHRNTNIGEIEDRRDSKQHYRQIKFRLKAQPVFDILTDSIPNSQRLSDQLVVYGAANKFSI